MADAFKPCERCAKAQFNAWCLPCFDALREALKEHDLYPFDAKRWREFLTRSGRGNPTSWDSDEYVAFQFWQEEQDRQPRKRVHWVMPEHMDEVWQRDAMIYVRKAVARGVLPDLRGKEYACVDCGAIATLYEHRSYLRPLDVEPVCRMCNAKRGTAHWPSAADFNFKRITEHS